VYSFSAQNSIKETQIQKKHYIQKFTKEENKYDSRISNSNAQ